MMEVQRHQNVVFIMRFLEREMPEFILPLLRPPNLPDLNPVDYSMWSIGLLQEKESVTRITDLDNLKHRIRTEWAKVDHTFMPSLLQLCVSGVIVFQLVTGWARTTLCF